MKSIWLLGVASCFWLASCGGDPDTPSERTVTPVTTPEITTPAVPALPDFADATAQFTEQARLASQRIVETCNAMQVAIQTFAEAPSEAGLKDAQNGYQQCYQQWRAASLFYRVAFDLSEQIEFQRLLAMIDTRPYLPGYIDGIPEYPYSGLVHELDIPITPENLRSQHRLMDEESAAIGFPVMEFFLWKVPVEAFWLANQPGDDKTLVARRLRYLTVASDLLQAHLGLATNRWLEPSAFEALPERAQLALIWRSLQEVTLTELLNGAMEADDVQEPEWHHPAPYSGQGLVYVQRPLETVLNYATEGGAPLLKWLEQLPEPPVTAAELQESLNKATTTVAKLPENYPADSEMDEPWQAAQQAVAQLALQVSRLNQFVTLRPRTSP